MTPTAIQMLVYLAATFSVGAIVGCAIYAAKCVKE